MPFRAISPRPTLCETGARPDGLGAKMRLTCPNCGAQYEVPEDVIPDEGRDVQCSNCGFTWFQTPDGPAEPAAEVAPDAAPQEEPEPEPEPVGDAGTPVAPDEDSAPARAAEPEPQTAPQPSPEASEAAPGQPETPRRRLDPEVEGLLREEAERETRARAADSQPLETQPDLGLEETRAEDDAERRSRAAREHMSRIRGEDAGESEAARRSSRGSLLPDIDEINSSLRSGGDTAREPAPEPEPIDQPEAPPARSGFARGFAIALLLGVVAIVLYANADRIAEALPSFAPLLDAYVAAMDAARGWAAETITALLVWLDGLAGE